MGTWFKRNWKTLAGVACGAGSVAAGVLVNPMAGAALGAVCGYIFGSKPTSIGQGVANSVRDVLAEAKKADGGVIVTTPDDKSK